MHTVRMHARRTHRLKSSVAARRGAKEQPTTSFWSRSSSLRVYFIVRVCILVRFGKFLNRVFVPVVCVAR